MRGNSRYPGSDWDDVLDAEDAPPPRRIAPGKVTLTSLIPTARRAPVQRSTAAAQARAVAPPGQTDVHAAAEAGTRGSGSALPHREAIQKSFGNHDVFGMQAYIGGAAEKANQDIGAQAYATGNKVAFRSQPDLHTAAHEAAHVVQQRGGVSLKGGVGESGDRHEQHADAVADRVVRGESAEPLLDPVAGGSQPASAGRAIQKTGEDTAAPASDAQGADPNLTYGNSTQISATARIPTPVAGLTVDVTLTGKYSTLHENGQDAVELEGVAQISLSYRLLFLRLSLFLRGSVKAKVRGTTSGDEALSRGLEEISHWIAARELADLPARRQEVSERYMHFESSITHIFIDLFNSSGSERYDELRQADWGWLWDNSMANIVDARTSLVDEIRDIFGDMEGTIQGTDVYPGSPWIQQQINPYLDQNNVTGDELSAFMRTLTDEASRRRRQVSSQLEQIPAIANDPDVEFEANVQIGVSAGIQLDDDNSATIEVGSGVRIGDAMDATSFDTSTSQVYFGSLGVSGDVHGLAVQGQLAYEGVGPAALNPDSFKVGGQVFVGMSASDEDPEAYSSTLEGVKNRAMTADLWARVDGVSRLRTLGTVLKREIGAARGPSWSAGAESMAGFDVEFKFKKQQNGQSYDPDGGHVKFVITHTSSLSLGAFEGSVQSGSYVGITW